MSLQETLSSVPQQLVNTALRVLEERFTLRKDVGVGLFLQEDSFDGIWGFLTILLWAFCIYMRRYDNILRGCSPIVLETVIPLLRVMLVEGDTTPKKEDGLSSPGGNVHTNRGHTVSGAVSNSGARHGAVPQRRKEKMCSQTAFATEQLVWFVLIFLILDITNIHRLSVGFFVSNTLQWSGIDTWMSMCLVAMYAFGTIVWYPSYPVRDSLLSLSVQRTWVYSIYSSYSLAFSLTLLLTETQLLQRTRHDIVSKLLSIPSLIDCALSNTLASPVVSFFRRLPDYFFFVGFKFFMAFCMWFSTMIFEWTLDASCTGIMCTLFALPAMLEGFFEDRSSSLRDGLISFIMYSILTAIAYLCLPARTISFLANSMLSSFFVLYIAARSPRPVRSVLPLVLIWLVMIIIDAYWQFQRTVIVGTETKWYNKFLCANTIAFGGLFMIATAIQMYRWQLRDTSQLASCVSMVSSISTAKNPRRESKQKDELSSETLTPNSAITVEPSSTGAMASSTENSLFAKQRTPSTSATDDIVFVEHGLHDSCQRARWSLLSVSKSTENDVFEEPVDIEELHAESEIETSTDKNFCDQLCAFENSLPIPTTSLEKMSLNNEPLLSFLPNSENQKCGMSHHSLIHSEEVAATPLDTIVSSNVKEKTTPTGETPTAVVCPMQSWMLSNSSLQTNSSVVCGDNSVQEVELSTTSVRSTGMMTTPAKVMRTENKSLDNDELSVVALHAKKDLVEVHTEPPQERAKEPSSLRSKGDTSLTAITTGCMDGANCTTGVGSNKHSQKGDVSVSLMRDPLLLESQNVSTNSVELMTTPAPDDALHSLRSDTASSVGTVNPALILAAKTTAEKGTKGKPAAAAAATATKSAPAAATAAAMTKTAPAAATATTKAISTGATSSVTKTRPAAAAAAKSATAAAATKTAPAAATAATKAISTGAAAVATKTGPAVAPAAATKKGQAPAVTKTGPAAATTKSASAPAAAAITKTGPAAAKATSTGAAAATTPSAVATKTGPTVAPAVTKAGQAAATATKSAPASAAVAKTRPAVEAAAAKAISTVAAAATATKTGPAVEAAAAAVTKTGPAGTEEMWRKEFLHSSLAYRGDAEAARASASAPARRGRERQSSRSTPPVNFIMRSSPAKEAQTGVLALALSRPAPKAAHLENEAPDVGTKSTPHAARAEVWGESAQPVETHDSVYALSLDDTKHPVKILSMDVQDDDVPLDFTHLNLALTEATPTPLSDQHGMSSSARSALENFAKLMMVQAPKDEEDVTSQSTTPGAANNTQCESQNSTKTPTEETLQYQPKEPQSQQPQPLWVQQWGQRQQHRANKSAPQVLPANRTNNIIMQSTARQYSPQLVSEGVQMPMTGHQQAPTQQVQTPMMLVRMNDGRMALCPVIPQAYSSMQPVFVPVSQVKMPPSQLREPQQTQHPIMIAPNGAIPMQTYPSLWATQRPRDHNSMQ